jgi:hypothetical protein
MDPKQKADLARKLNALRNTANDPSIKGTGEAINAMNLYNKLMTKYNLTLDDLELKASTITGDSRKHEHNATCLGHLSVMIAQYTDTRALTTGSGVIVFVGIPSDVQHATFLYDVISTAFKYGKSSYLNSPEFNKLQEQGMNTLTIMTQFEMGMTVSLHDALEKMIAEKRKANPGNSLIVLKNALIAQALGEENNGEASMDIIPAIDQRAMQAGLAEGDKVVLRKGMDSEVKGYLK